MDAQTNTEPTREGCTERTAPEGIASRGFKLGDRVTWPHGTGTLEGVFERGTQWSKIPFAKVMVGTEARYPNLADLTLVADAPAAVVAAVSEDAPLLLADEPIDLGDVDADDALIAASLDAASLLVRICAADDAPLFERVTINGVTWLVDVRPE